MPLRRCLSDQMWFCRCDNGLLPTLPFDFCTVRLLSLRSSEGLVGALTDFPFLLAAFVTRAARDGPAGSGAGTGARDGDGDGAGDGGCAMPAVATAVLTVDRADVGGSAGVATVTGIATATGVATAREGGSMDSTATG